MQVDERDYPIFLTLKDNTSLEVSLPYLNNRHSYNNTIHSDKKTDATGNDVFVHV